MVTFKQKHEEKYKDEMEKKINTDGDENQGRGIYNLYTEAARTRMEVGELFEGIVKKVLTICLLIGKPVYKLVAESKGP